MHFKSNSQLTRANCTLWWSFGFCDGSWGFANVCNVGWSLSLRLEKKQNKFPRNAPTYQRITRPINPYFYILIHIFQLLNYRTLLFRIALLHLHTTFGICKVGDCGFQTNQTVTKLNRATATKFSTITPILYIHCWLLRFISYLHSCFWTPENTNKQ